MTSYVYEKIDELHQRVKELEKENSELKRQLEECDDVYVYSEDEDYD